MPAKKKTESPEGPTIDELIALEGPVQALARSQADGPYVDAVKARLMGIAQQMGALGNAMEQIRSLER